MIKGDPCFTQLTKITNKDYEMIVSHKNQDYLEQIAACPIAMLLGQKPNIIDIAVNQAKVT